MTAELAAVEDSTHPTLQSKALDIAGSDSAASTVVGALLVAVEQLRGVTYQPGT